MIQIQSNQLGGLEWKQLSAFARAYELRSGDSVLASVEFKRSSEPWPRRKLPTRPGPSNEPDS